MKLSIARAGAVALAAVAVTTALNMTPAHAEVDLATKETATGPVTPGTVSQLISAVADRATGTLTSAQSTGSFLGPQLYGDNGCGQDLTTCYNARVKTALQASSPNSDKNARVYAAFWWLQPTFASNDQYDLWYLQSNGTMLKSGHKLRTLTNRVTSTNTTAIVDWRPNGTTQDGPGSTQSFTVGFSRDGLSASIGRSWTSYRGKIKGFAPYNSGKAFAAAWEGSTSDPIAMVSGAVYKTPAGKQVSWNLEAVLEYNS